MAHYYKHNIPDWRLATAHLTPEEEGVYLRLCHYYYDTEQPIPLETQQVMRRLRLGNYEAMMMAMLEEFFVKTSDGWKQERCEEEIADIVKTGNTSRKNGRKGGRPGKSKNYSITQQVYSGIPAGSETKPISNPAATLPINPLPINPLPKQDPDKSGSAPKYSDTDYEFAEWMWAKVLAAAPKQKKPDLKTWAEVIRKIRELDGHSHKEIGQVFKYANDHVGEKFSWRTNILSPKTLREKFGKLHAEMILRASNESGQRITPERESTVSRNSRKGAERIAQINAELAALEQGGGNIVGEDG